jgi:adenylate kinase family enzyme
MERIVVLGCPGSGKSTLARELAARTGIPAVHLDRLYWQPGWKPHPDLEAFRAAVDGVAAGERWILDGGFLDSAGHARFKRADAAVLLDFPTHVCLYRAVRRWWTYRGETRPDLAPGCEEQVDFEFYRYILSYRARQLPQVDATLAQLFNGQLIRIRNDGDRALFLSAL